MMSDIPFSRAIQNLDHHIKTVRFAPTVSEIRGNVSGTDVERLRLETQQRFLLMDEWEKNAGRLLLTGGEADE
ncbi:hypothetical protein ACP8HI_04370 [Paenibacillus sp. FA6]|uniref:hypothetical protein n=1 Tax=Paenibacillus sp. FA6 TaxID=3413029 RepID=UPI003F65A53A